MLADVSGSVCADVSAQARRKGIAPRRGRHERRRLRSETCAFSFLDLGVPPRSSSLSDIVLAQQGMRIINLLDNTVS